MRKNSKHSIILLTLVLVIYVPFSNNVQAFFNTLTPGNFIQVLAVKAAENVSQVGDIDNDGVINIIDLEAVASFYGMGNHIVGVDVNDDDTVDIFDLVKVSKYINTNEEFKLVVVE